MMRPVGSPLPLGMLALGAASIVLTGEQLKWLPLAETHEVALVVLVFTVPLQFLAAVFGYLSRDGAGGTGMAVLAGSWVTIGLLQLLSTPGTRSPTLGLFLFFASGALAVPVVAASLGKILAAMVFFMAAFRFALTGIYEFNGGGAWQHASGWFGLALCIVAVYSSMAFELEDTEHHTVLPVLRWGTGRRAMDGSFIDEVERVQREAGVREQL